ncbi:MAG: hypothetical protein QF684_00050 [Candidatus Thalassarchaeaceae archaeon]|nr:hypothetical protein [Candidatus Thalassarchaeaceae archaeon]
MIRREHDEEAVSAAIATVLLFAGVISIISGMMVTVIPVIDELHGAVERENMVGQMEDLASETERLSESGTPGDSAQLTIRPHTGTLGWQLLEGGTWYSATHQPDSSFRLEGVLDLDDTMRLRHAEHRIESLCVTNLHASAESLNHYRLPILDGEVTATPLNALTSLLGSNHLSFEQNDSIIEHLISTDDVWALPSLSASAGESWIHSEMPLRVVLWRGAGGAFSPTPDQPIPGSDEGRSWTIPLIANSHSVHLESDSPFTLEWEVGTSSGEGSSSTIAVLQTPSGEPNTIHSWDGEISIPQAQQLVLRTSASARMVIHWGDAVELDGEGPGAIPWLDRSGSSTGIHFRPPAMDGSLIIHNPNIAPTTAKIGNLYHAISGYSSIRIPWDAGDLSWIEGGDPIQVEWVLDTQTVGSTATHAMGWRPGSLSISPAADTGRISGTDWKFEPPKSGGTLEIPTVGSTSFILQPAGPTSSWTTNLNQYQAGHSNHSSPASSLSLDANHIGAISIESTDGALRIYSAAGEDGSTEIPEDGADRCVSVGLRASGWIEVELPWASVDHWKASDIRNAWRDGTHFFGLQLSIRGAAGDDPHATLGSAWALHLPRLTYTFDSSVTDLQILTRGGFVGTNHPEYQADVLIPPPSREGPGPRLAATVPVAMPTMDSVGGSAQIELTLTLDVREQVATIDAHQVRRGWDGPYAVAIAAESSAEVEYSSDWLAFPGQLEMLNDYVGWVQTSPTMPEVVYHAGGESVLFNLQVASLTSQTNIGGTA